MSDIGHEAGEGHNKPLSHEDRIRALYGEFDDGSEPEYALLNPDTPTNLGGIALQPPGGERVLELNQR